MGILLSMMSKVKEINGLFQKSRQEDVAKTGGRRRDMKRTHLFFLFLLLALMGSVWALGEGSVTYVGPDGELSTRTDAVMIEAGSTSWKNGWYAVSESVSLEDKE